MTEKQLTHLNERGDARMVDVSGKAVTTRTAVAESRIRMLPETLELIETGGHRKGDVFAVARIAGIQAAKRTSELIPLCHPLPLGAVEVEFAVDVESSTVVATATCKIDGKTGVEMEALTAASIATLTIYDMCKAVDKGIVIEATRLMSKSGGKSGDWEASS